MSKDDREVVNPFGEALRGISAEKQAQIELSELWAYYLNGGGGQPWYFEGYSSMEGYRLSRQR
jgi:hypothetical protein